MSFKMKCPKCESVSYSVERDNRTYATGKSGELVFSCRCGKQLFGDQLTAEYDRQKAQWDADPARRAAFAEREQRQRDDQGGDDTGAQQRTRHHGGVHGQPPGPAARRGPATRAISESVGDAIYTA